MEEKPGRFLIVLLWVQGLYFLITGVWPLVSIQTFMAVTGPKFDHEPHGNDNDHWLVYTVAVLIVAGALAMLYSAWKKRCPVEVVIVALGMAIGLTMIDVIFVSRGVIAPIYLADAAAEVVLIAAWLIGLTIQTWKTPMG
jgi:peptidoglycan/LPS O-acetylase OafA/YrhL